MPYKLRKAPMKELYWVVTTETGKKHSKQPIPLLKAKAQMRILEASELSGGGFYKRKLYSDVKEFISNLQSTGTTVSKQQGHEIDNLVTRGEQAISKIGQGDSEERGGPTNAEMQKEIDDLRQFLPFDSNPETSKSRIRTLQNRLINRQAKLDVIADVKDKISRVLGVGIEYRNIPPGSTDIVTYEEITSGEPMTSLDRGYEHGQYMTRETQRSLPRQSINPLTNIPWATKEEYTAKIEGQPKAHKVDTSKPRNIVQKYITDPLQKALGVPEDRTGNEKEEETFSVTNPLIRNPAGVGLGKKRKHKGKMRGGVRGYTLKREGTSSLYWVVDADTGEKYTKTPLPANQAMEQRRIAQNKLSGGVLGFVGKYSDMVQKEYREAYKKNPTLPKLEDVREYLNNKDLEWMVGVLSTYKTWDNYIQKAKASVAREMPVNLINFLEKRNAFTANVPKMLYYLKDISLLLRAIPKSQYDMAEEAEKPASKNPEKEQAAYMNLRKVYDQLKASGLSDAQVKANGIYLAAKKAFESAKSGGSMCQKCGKERR